MKQLHIATLLYHEVCDDPRTSGFQRRGALPYKHSREKFRQELDAIALTDRKPKLVSEIDFSALGRHVLLTFDDGGKSAVYVADQLSARNWKAHFFITTSRVDTPTFVSSADIQYIRSCGHVIGSHSHNHPDIFRDLSPMRLHEEWRISRNYLEDILGEVCVCASVPGGDISAAVIGSAADCGIRYLFTSEPHLSPFQFNNAWVLGRASMKAAAPLDRVYRLVSFEGWTRERAQRRVRVALTKMLYPLYRQYVKKNTAEDSNAA